MKKQLQKLSSILLCFVMLLGLLPTTALAADEINQVSLTLDVPVIGKTLDFTPTADAGNYEITSVRWLKDWGEHGNMLCDEYHKVEPGEPYTVRIWINPTEGNTFADLDDVTVTVNGSTDGVTFTHNDLYTGIICSVAFEKLGYAVSFDANGGTGTMDKVTDVYPDYTLPACGFTAPEGKVFNGWTVGSASGKWYAAGSTMSVNADVTMYAKWADPTGSHKITFVNRAYNPNPTVEILVSEGMYTLPQIESIFEIPSGSTFDDWGINTSGSWQYFDAGREISVTEDLEIIAIWAPIEYESISKAVFEVKLNAGAEYKHGMLAGSLSVSLGEVTGSFNEGAAQPISLASGGYGHGYWIVSGDMLQGTDPLSTRGGYRLYVKFDIPDDRNVRFNSDDFSLSGDLGNITAWNIVSLDGALVAVFKLPAVPGTELGTENITFTLNGYEAGETITAITAGVDTPHVSLRGSGYGSRLDDKSYMIWKDYYDYGYGVYDGSSKFENSRFYYLEINYALDEGYSFPANFWDGDELIKEKFKLSGFEKAEVYQVDRNSIVFRLPQMGNTVIENVEFILNGYKEGEAVGNVTVTILDKMIFPRDDLDYFFYDESVGFSPDGTMSPISATMFENGKRYYIAMLIGATDGYDASELEMGDFTIHTPYGSCTATGYGRATAFVYNEYYYVGFELPVINNASFTTYTVSFDADGGTGTMSDVIGVFGEYTLPACGFTAPSDKQFKAWSVSGVEKAVGDKITVTADTTVTAVWETVSEYTKKGDISAVTATADIAPVLGAKTSAVSFTITNPTDAAAKGVIFSGTSWYKKDTSSIYGWTQCSNGVDTFEEGTYRLSVQLRSKSNDAKEYYAMSGDTTFTVNGVQWNSEEPFRDYYATDGYGYRFFVSPEFTLGGKTLDSIAVTTPPTTTAYREGEDFNPAGMVVTATYTDSTTAPVVLYTVTDGSALTAGKTTVTISYTEGGVTKTATQTITVAKEYTVTVEGGTGTGKYVAGEEVTISAFVSGGRKFKEWQGTEGLAFTSGDKNSQTATFTMPAHDVTVTAVTGPAEYYVSVSGGSGTGMYETGETVTIVADPPEVGKQFKEWSVGDGKVLRFAEGDITSSTAKFFMPGEAVRISATYEDIPVTTYAITFNANGGSVTPASAETGADGKLTSLPTPTRSGSYSFNGWYTAASGGTKVTASTVFNANTTIYAQWTYTGGGGGGGGYVSTYAITVEDAKNGDVTVSHKSTYKGATVTVTVDPDKGYSLETLTVTDKNGKEIELNNKGDGKYTFKMPGSKVTVKATFMDDNTMLNFFVDVPADAYYYDAVLWAVKEGITNGTSATTFSPDSPCTRAQMATFLWRAAGSPEPVSKTCIFTDVPADAYYAKAVQWAYEQKITVGTSATTFSPDETCTRAQMATFLCRVADGEPVSDSVIFNDVKADKYYAKSVQWAYEQKITVGTSATTFSPDDPCTRAQMVTFLYRYFVK